jgi:radical SAM superfamily enzyme YgiQ (UPF0313 family)
MVRIMLIEPGTQTREGVMRILASIGTNKVNWKFPPLDLLGVGGILRKNNINDFMILDALNLELTHEQTKEYIKKENPEAVVFTFTVFTAKNDMKIASIAKEVNPAIKTIAVNFAAESYEGNILKDFPDLDFLAYHEPEYPILDLVRANYKPEKVGGIYYRDGLNIKKNPERLLINLDDIGIMAHDKIPLHIYRSPHQKRRPISATAFTRGCINKCTHCLSLFLNLRSEFHSGSGHVRYRSYDSIKEELGLLTSLGVRELRFFDNELTADMAWAEGIFDMMIRDKIDITFSCNVRADTVNDALLKKMKKAGCHLISIGVDSANQKILDNMKKNLTIGQINNAINLIRKHNFMLSTYTTFGHEGESRETMMDTIAFIKKINPDICSFSFAVPIKGTEFYDFLIENNFLDISAPLESYDPNLPPVYSYPQISSDEMYKTAMYAYRSFYFRPAYIFRRLLRSYSRRDDIKYMFFCIQRYILEPLKRKK